MNRTRDLKMKRDAEHTKEVQVFLSEDEYDFVLRACRPGEGVPRTIRNIIQEVMKGDIDG